VANINDGVIWRRVTNIIIINVWWPTTQRNNNANRGIIINDQRQYNKPIPAMTVMTANGDGNDNAYANDNIDALWPDDDRNYWRDGNMTIMAYYDMTIISNDVILKCVLSQPIIVMWRMVDNDQWQWPMPMWRHINVMTITEMMSNANDNKPWY